MKASIFGNEYPKGSKAATRVIRNAIYDAAETLRKYSPDMSPEARDMWLRVCINDAIKKASEL